MKSSTVRKRWMFLAAGLAIVPLLYAGKAWEKSSYQEWSKDDAVKVITDSPWGQRIVFRELVAPSNTAALSAPPQPSEGSRTSSSPSLGPSGGVQLQARASSVYTVSFLSARPLRMALARLAMLSGALDAAGAEQFVEQNPFQGKIAVSVAVPGDQKDSIFMQLTTGELQDSTYLEFKKSKRRVYLESFLKPGEAGNDQAVFFFPRLLDGAEVVDLSEDEVKFVSRLNAQTELEQRFKLKKMVFDGKLEI